MIKRAFFSVSAAVSAMAVAGIALAAGQHAGGYVHPEQG